MALSEIFFFFETAPNISQQAISGEKRGREKRRQAETEITFLDHKKKVFISQCPNA